jgi:hypothetical protein
MYYNHKEVVKSVINKRSGEVMEKSIYTVYSSMLMGVLGLLVGTATIFADTAIIKNSSGYVVNVQILQPISGKVLATFSARPNETQTVDVGQSCPLQVIQAIVKGNKTGSILLRQCNMAIHTNEFTIKGRGMYSLEDTDIFSLEEGLH